MEENYLRTRQEVGEKNSKERDNKICKKDQGIRQKRTQKDQPGVIKQVSTEMQKEQEYKQRK